MANVKLEIVNRPDVNDASQDVMISDIANSGEIFEDAGAYYKAIITLDADETLAGTTEVTLENGIVIPVSSDTLLGYTSFSDSLDDLYLNGEREFVTTIQEVSHSVFSEINATTFSEENVSITMNDNHTESLVGIFKINSDEDQDNVKFRVVLDTPPKVDTIITVLVDGVERLVTFPAVTDEAVLAAGDPVVEILEVQTDLQQPDVYVDPKSLIATITKINGVVLTEGVDSEGGQIKYLNGVNIGDFERLQLFKETATSLINDTETPVHVNLTATPSTSEDTGSITYTATLSEADLSDEEVIKHKGVTVTLDEKDADGNDIIINIAEGERSGTVDIAVNRDDIYKESDDVISNKIKSVENVLADDAVGAFESLVANTDLVTTAIEDESDAIKVTLTQVKEDGSAFAAGESTDIKEGESAFYKVDAAHDGNNVNTPDPITGTVDVQFTNGTTTFGDYLVNGETLGADGKLAAVAFGSMIEVQAPEDNSYEGEDGETFSVSLVADSAVPTDAPAGSSDFELVHYEGSATTTIKENQRPVDVKLVPTDEHGNILADGSQVVESQQAYYKVILVAHGTDTDIGDTSAGKVTVSISDGTALVTEDYMDKVFVDGAEVADKKVDIGTVFTVKTVDNLFDEQAEKYQVSINTPELAPKYKVEVATSTVETTITDDEDPIMISLEQVKNEAGDAFVAGESKVVKEGEKAFYQVKATKDSGNDIDDAIAGSVDVKFTGLSTGDYDASELTKNVAFGSVISTTIVDDYLAEAAESFDVSLVEDSAKPTDTTKSFEKVNLADPVTTVIEDNETPVTLKLIPVDLDGNPIVDADGNPISKTQESKQAYYKAVLFDKDGNEIVDVDSTVTISLSNGLATKAEDYHDKIFVEGSEVSDKKVKLGTVFSVDTKDNLLKEEDENFAVRMADFSNASSYENVIYVNPTTTIIEDDIDPVEVQVIQVSDANRLEGEVATYKAVLVNQVTGVAVAGVTGNVDITFSNGSTQGASDFTSATTNVALNVTFTAAIVDDLIKENPEAFTVGAANFTVGGTAASDIYEEVAYASPVTTKITDNNSEVTIKLIPLDPETGEPMVDADGNPVSMVEESKQAHYVAELYSNGTKIEGATGTVDIVLEDVTALDSEDYDGTIQTVTIGTPFTVDTVDNYFQEADETFKVSVDAETFSEKSTYEGVVGSTVVTTIKDDIDPLNITLEATPGTGEDGGSIVYTAKVNTEGTLTPVHHDGIEVKLDNGETIMISQDAMSGAKTVAVNRDDVYKEEDSISNHIVSVQEAGRGLESLTFDDAVQKTIINDDEDAVTATLTADTVGTTTTLNVALSQAMMHDVKNPLSFTIADNGTAMKDAAGNDVVITINTGETMGSLTVDDMSIGAHDITFLALPTQDNMGDFEAITPVIDKSTKLDIIPPCPLDPEDDCTFIRQGDTKNIDVLGNDGGTDLKILSVEGVEHGSVSITEDGRCLTYTSDDTMISGERLNTDTGIIESYRENPFFGTDSFTYTVEDKYGQIGTATVDAHIISTGDKRDVFNGDARDEYVVAGGGNDYLAGGAGNDAYFFSKGDDKDVIMDTAGDDDRIVFTSNVGNDTTQLQFKLESDGDLLVCYGESGDMITVKNQQQTGAIDRIEMYNGCYLSNSDVDKIVQTLSAYNAEGADGAHMISEIQNDAKFGQIVWHNYN